MPSSPQTSKPLLFRLPLEVRLMIYRHAWKVDPKPHTKRGTRQLTTSYLKQQLTAIGRLGAICQQMRTEAFDEYFHHAQAFLRWDYDGSGSKTRHNHSYKELILSSPTLLAHLRHVSFHWADKEVHKGEYVSPMEALYWLQCLKQLKTLELVIPRGYVRGDYFGDSYRQKQVLLSLSNLRGLEKATIKFEDYPYHFDNPEYLLSRLSERCLVRKFMKEFESLVTLPKLLEGAEPPCQAIKEHLGCLNPRWLWNRSDRI
ncbi:hypothetical protein GE21DRAFT_6158 [Neurospora crassa]|uniref:F-box domain-containing protein n=2 Tax=Neurospora crassa TaxID=5141 RepID=Q7RWR5_NEUCR|nr:hypothetical protein NCU04365 [Neurospora crassa OR74A]EAA26902.1 hypothetical protein NCU04365 [Neurospora crassa OR74A]KHE82325.1 hypothetical protein GE21DRAFT_6158 [Neurospora crassa]CAF06084.1 hypothetical protein 29E8.510 [Neurospora crassa]|eukprot:XP_956138.1 hypothetical protein NCU04365 [Neurospora crassa OR74A]